MPKSQNILIVGATSAIAEACARLWATEKATLYLIARNSEKLDLVTRDLTGLGARVQSAVLDVNDMERHAAVVDEAFRALSRIDVVLIAHGNLPEQPLCQTDVKCMLDALQTNGISVVSLLTIIAHRLQAQGSGVLAVIGSVAGDRGRKSNYVYGSAKALVATFMEGLAARMQPYNVAIINIKPGLVDTPMTAKFEKSSLWSNAGTIAEIIHARVASGISGSVYAPRFWWVIMTIIKHIPAFVFYRLKL
jgi:NADP-dependent 3-hydroxy acid dehydrogenase YdfG